MLTELSRPAVPADAVTDLSLHLRLPFGFDADPETGRLLVDCLESALAAVEALTARALLSRPFLWRVARWAAPSAQDLPVEPVSAVDGLTLETREGGRSDAPPDRWRFDPAAGPPRLLGRHGRDLPTIPDEGVAEARFTAGYGVDWTSVPPDLRAAAVALAAARFERPESDAETPAGVAAAVARYRRFRL